jgi:hypothetical protein
MARAASIKYSKFIKTVREALDTEMSMDVSEDEANAVADYIIEALGLEERITYDNPFQEEEESSY